MMLFDNRNMSCGVSIEIFVSRSALTGRVGWFVMVLFIARIISLMVGVKSKFMACVRSKGTF